jgi:hypothetical protein
MEVLSPVLIFYFVWERITLKYVTVFFLAQTFDILGPFFFFFKEMRTNHDLLVLIKINSRYDLHVKK